MSRPDTPFKPYATYTHCYERTPAPQQRALAIDEVAGCVFQDVPEFLDTFFPVDLLANGSQSGQNRLDQILMDLAMKDLLKPLTDEWPKIPKAGLEAGILPPLAEIFNAITKLCQSKDSKPDIMWSDVHSKQPQSVYNPLLRPDIVATIDKHPERGRAHWHNVLLPVEVKRRSHPEQAVPQLVTYAKTMLREQWNRRFTFAFLFTRSEFQVWLFDRAGGIASPMIDYWKQPRELVRVISGVTLNALGSLPKLGYDPTMTLLRRSSTNAADAQWRVNGPDGQQFIVFEPGSLNRANVLVGRATRIWKAWKDDESIPPEQRQVFIIKDTWRDDRRNLEGDLYKKSGQGEGLAGFLCDGIVTVDEIPDKTATLIRDGIKPTSGPLVLARPRLKGESNWEEDSSSIPQSAEVSMDIDNTSRIHGRTHSRTILTTFGWPIYRFRSQLELIRTLRGAVQGHQHLYKHNVLHRDISSTNILIVPNGQKLENPEDTRGCLIDLDYGIDLETHETVTNDERTGTPAFMSDQILTGFPFGNFHLHGVQHDMESFFWVLCWLITKYKGPHTENPAFSRGKYGPNKIFEDSFESMGRYKNAVILGENAVETMLFPHIRGFFEPLKPTVRSLAKILKTAFTKEAYDGLHQQFLDVLAEAELICQNSPPSSPYFLVDDGDGDNPPVYVMQDDVARLEDKRRVSDMLPPSLRPKPKPMPTPKSTSKKRKRNRTSKSSKSLKTK